MNVNIQSPLVAVPKAFCCCFFFSEWLTTVLIQCLLASIIPASWRSMVLFTQLPPPQIFSCVGSGVTWSERKSPAEENTVRIYIKACFKDRLVYSGWFCQQIEAICNYFQKLPKITLEFTFLCSVEVSLWSGKWSFLFYAAKYPGDHEFYQVLYPVRYFP